MRKLLLTTAAVAAAIGLAGCSKKEPITYGTLTDERDRQTYKTVKIGTQTWVAQNINYQTESGSWCYKNSADSCNKYGRLYDWKTATTVCPKGWKLPSREDWDRLVETAGEKLKSKSGWNENGNGTDNYGFSALPGGGRDYIDGRFYYAGNRGHWWTATVDDSDKAYGRIMNYNNDYVGENNYNKSNGQSVRCVADRP